MFRVSRPSSPHAPLFVIFSTYIYVYYTHAHRDIHTLTHWHSCTRRPTLLKRISILEIWHRIPNCVLIYVCHIWDPYYSLSGTWVHICCWTPKGKVLLYLYKLHCDLYVSLLEKRGKLAVILRQFLRNIHDQIMQKNIFFRFAHPLPLKLL